MGQLGPKNDAFDYLAKNSNKVKYCVIKHITVSDDDYSKLNMLKKVI